MNNLDFESLKAQPDALIQPSIPDKDIAVLDLLSDGVFIIDAQEPRGKVPAQYLIHYANLALTLLVQKESQELMNQPLDTLFSKEKHSVLYEALEQARLLKTRRDVDIVFQTGSHPQQLRIALVPNLGAKTLDGENSALQIICSVNNITSLTTRANYLEDRAAKLIDHTNELETSRKDLEKKVKKLLGSIRKMERMTRFDKITGLSNRAFLLEQGAAEFQRSKRYSHLLSIVVIRMQGFEQIIKAHDAASGDLAFTGLAQICETACRSGTDVAGRISQLEIAMILPETGLTGALQFVERLRALISETPIQLSNGFVRLGIRSSVDSMQEDDQSFMQSLNRAQGAMSDI